MSIFGKIKDVVWTYNYEKERSKLERDRSTFNLDSAKKIGILYNASEEADYKKVTEFVRYLQNKQIQVKALGYVQSNLLPHYCHPKLAFDFFHLKDINWFGRPGSKYIDDFIHEEFDVVIDLNIDENYAIKYIAGMSKARFKAGPFREKDKEIYDFMINLKPEDNINEFIRQIIHYLSIINHS